MAQSRRFRAQVGVDRGTVGAVAVAALVVATGLTRQQQKSCVIGPGFRQIGQVDCGPGKAAGEFRIAICFGIKCCLQMLLGGKIIGHMGFAKPVCLLKRSGDVPIRQEWQFRPPQCGTRCSSGICLENNPRIGAQKERRLIGIGFGKTRVFVGVKRKCSAALVGGTGAFTRFQSCIKRRRNITARQISILTKHKAPFRNQILRRGHTCHHQTKAK